MAEINEEPSEHSVHRSLVERPPELELRGSLIMLKNHVRKVFRDLATIGTVAEFAITGEPFNISLDNLSVAMHQVSVEARIYKDRCRKMAEFGSKNTEFDAVVSELQAGKVSELLRFLRNLQSLTQKIRSSLLQTSEKIRNAKEMIRQIHSQNVRELWCTDLLLKNSKEAGVVAAGGDGGVSAVGSSGGGVVNGCGGGGVAAVGDSGVSAGGVAQLAVIAVGLSAHKYIIDEVEKETERLQQEVHQQERVMNEMMGHLAKGIEVFSSQSQASFSDGEVIKCFQELHGQFCELKESLNCGITP